jgi:8-oxo-dGTP pyrophosphatase MutT (NUDIX family)
MTDDLHDQAERWPVAGHHLAGRGTLLALRTDRVVMPDGQEAARDVLEHPGAVGVVALDGSGQVLLIRQYRHPVGRLLWEIPAGLRDAAGEKPLATAQRELAEEAGQTAQTWHVLTDTYTSPGYSTERLRVYLARDLAPVPPGEDTYRREHEEAYLVSAWVPLARAVQLILAGGLHNGPAVIGVLAADAAQRGGFAGLRAPDAAED